MVSTYNQENAIQSNRNRVIMVLNGDTNIKYLVDNGCNIWNGDCYKHYLNNYKPDDENEPDWMRPESDFQCLPEEEFINKIKTDSKFAKNGVN
jgi:thymidylate synthase